MMFAENFRMARTSLRSARLRSFLTMLGIIIGVVSVITIFSLGEGVKRQLQGEANHLGNGIVTVRPGKLVNRDQIGTITGVNLLFNFSATPLSEQDLTTVTKTPGVKSAVPFSLIVGSASADKRSFDKGFIIGTTSQMPDLLKQKVEFGSFFNDEDQGKRTAVIGRGVAEQLFQEAVPIGKSMQIRGQEFIVRGVFEKFETSALNPGVDFNAAIFIPSDTGKAISGNQVQIYQILAQLDKPDEAVSTAATLSAALQRSHGGQEDFTVLKQGEAVSASGEVIRLVTRMIALVAAISLLVGGIGIMNVTLVSVSERTREIGLRKAIGATNAQIRNQFMIEAGLLSFWGATVGVIIAGLLNLAIRIFSDFQPVITWQVVLASMGVSVLVGLIFGTAPAIKASRKNPIDALRSM